MEPRRRPRTRRRLVVPIVLAMTVSVGATALVGSAAGCSDDDTRRPDAGVGDAGIDTPII